LHDYKIKEIELANKKVPFPAYEVFIFDDFFYYFLSNTIIEKEHNLNLQ
jgi:hypothetical protein